MSLAGYKKGVFIKTTSATAYTELPGTNATLNLAADMLDDTDFTSTGWRSRLPGLRDYSVSMTMNYDTSNTAFAAARTAWLNGSRLDFRYSPNGTVGFQGRVYVETFSHSGDVGGLETVDITLQTEGTAFTTY